MKVQNERIKALFPHFLVTKCSRTRVNIYPIN